MFKIYRFEKFDLQTNNHVTQGLSQAVLFKNKQTHPNLKFLTED